MRLPLLLTLAVGLTSASASTFGRLGQLARDPYRLAKRSENSKASAGNDHAQKPNHQATHRFLNHNTSAYAVHKLPDVHFDIGEMYSGLVPIDTHNESRALFFVFQPTIGAPVDEITIFLNGGPGCSSLGSFFQETGRFLWKPGTYLPTENPYSWVNLTNMLWVDQPVGAGYSIGTPTANSEEEIAQDFIKFFKNFQEIFGIRNFKIYVTGESYAGRYVPYISAAMLDAKDKQHYDLKGALVYDPCIGSFASIQQELPTVPFVKKHADLFNFNATFMAQLEDLHQKCGYDAYLKKYMTFPAAGVQPPMYFDYEKDADCDVFDLVINEALRVNPCFNLYRVSDMCPIPWDVLGFPTELMELPAGATIYFDRADVKKAMHAPNKEWAICSSEPVFTGGSSGPEQEGDISADPIQHVLPQVIEATNRVLVSNGDYDLVIMTEGTLLSIMNTTWNGHLGFQSKPSTPFKVELPDLEYAEVFAENGASDIDGPQGVMGIHHYERGLMWVETYQSGHMQPQYQPRASYRHLQWLLGHIDAF